MAADGNTFLAKPTRSPLYSATAIYGADFPSWQRNLYPVTYQTDAYEVARALQRIETETRITRKAMWRALKSGDARSVQTYRKALDRFCRYARNCRTQLLLIAAHQSAQAGLQVIEGHA